MSEEFPKGLELSHFRADQSKNHPIYDKCVFFDSPPIEGVMKNREDVKEEGWVEIGKVVPDVLHNGERDVRAEISMVIGNFYGKW